MKNKKMKKVFVAIVVGLLGVALLLIVRPMARQGSFFLHVLGVVIFVLGCVGLEYLQEIFSSSRKKRTDEDKN